MRKNRILLIEDEEGLILTLSDRFEKEQFEVETANNGTDGLDLAKQNAHDVIVLDVMLPGKNGFDVCQELRKCGVQTPVILLTAKSQVIDKVLGLKLGANDYLTKPFEMAELLARIEVQLRTTQESKAHLGAENNVVQFGNVTIMIDRGEVVKGHKPIVLSLKEFQLLTFFVQHPGKVHSRDELLNQVWGYDSAPSTRTVDVHVAWLRQKLEENPKLPKHLVTVHGRGYKFKN